MIKEETRLYVPRFKVESHTPSLKEELASSGVTEIFDEYKSDFSRFGEAGIFWADDLMHKSSLVVDETGANQLPGVKDGEFKFSCVGSAVEFRVDRPFLCIFHCGESIVLAAKVMAPLQFEG